MSDPRPASDRGVTKISKNGDIILAVGPKREKIQVASDFLEHVSPVFKAMLNAPMKEGETLRNRVPNSSVTIALPEDCPKSMKHMLQILYGADDLELDFLEVYHIMILADKYATIDRLNYFLLSWLHKNTDNLEDSDYKDRWNALVIAYLLGNRWYFWKLSTSLAWRSDPMVEWAAALPDRELGFKLALAFEELRHANEIYKEVHGLCIYCFTNVQSSFTDMQKGCDHEDFH